MADEAAQETPKEEYSNSIFLVKKKGSKDPFKTIFVATPEEGKEKIDRIVKGEDLREVRRSKSKKVETEKAALTPMNAYVGVNSSQWVLIDTIGKSLTEKPRQQFNRFITKLITSEISNQDYLDYQIVEAPLEDALSSVHLITEASRLIDALSVVRPALLMAFVASFDAFLADYLRVAIANSVEPLVYSDRKLTLREVLSAGDLESLKSSIIDDEVEQVLRDSHIKQIEYVRKACQFDPFDGYERKRDYLELFERRNLVAHGILSYNDSYTRNMKTYGYDVSNKGKKVSVPVGYLRKSLDILAEFACLSDFSYRVKNTDEEIENIIHSLNDRCVAFITVGRIDLAKWILKFLFGYKKPGYGEYARKMVTINLANTEYLSGDEEGARKTLSSYDWKAASDEFQICEASIRNDVDGVVKMMPRFADEEKIGKAEFREWPAFSRVKTSKKFQAKFKEVFGESLFKGSVQKILSQDGQEKK